MPPSSPSSHTVNNNNNNNNVLRLWVYVYILYVQYTCNVCGHYNVHVNVNVAWCVTHVFFVTFYFPPTLTSLLFCLSISLPLSTGTEVKGTGELTSTSPSVTEASKQTTGEHIQCTVYIHPSVYVSKSVCTSVGYTHVYRCTCTH